jgi:hypothetical protein
VRETYCCGQEWGLLPQRNCGTATNEPKMSSRSSMQASGAAAAALRAAADTAPTFARRIAVRFELNGTPVSADVAVGAELPARHLDAGAARGDRPRRRARRVACG